MILKKSFYSVCLLVVFMSGCATIKVPQVAGTNKGHGIVEMSYNYGGFEVPKVDWEQTLNTASGQCKSWGFEPAAKSSEPHEECISRG